MRAPKFFLFLLLMSGVLVVLNWQVQAGTQKMAPGGSASSLSSERQIEVVFRALLDELAKELPTKLTLYRSAPDEVGANQREALQAFLGKGTYFELQKASGGVFAGDMARLWAKAPDFTDEVKSPDEKRILMTAERFLENIKGQPGDQKTLQHVSVDTMELMDKGGQRRSLPMGVNVTYRRLLEGYEVVGPGGKLKVFYDTNGDIVGYLRVWRKLSPEKEKRPLISIHQAADRFKEDPLGRALLCDVDKVEVTEIRLAYLEHGIADRQQYLQPIYLFTCIAHVKSGDRMAQVPYARYMEALVKPPEALWPSGREYKTGVRPKTAPRPGED
jgi:hypothetical protein